MDDRKETFEEYWNRRIKTHHHMQTIYFERCISLDFGKYIKPMKIKNWDEEENK